MTESDIRLKLARDDDEDTKNGSISLHAVTPSALIMELLDIEDQQCVFSRITVMVLLMFVDSDANFARGIV